MSTSPWPRSRVVPRPRHHQLLLIGALVVGVGVRAARLDALAGGVSGIEVASGADVRAPAAQQAEPVKGSKANRERELRISAELVDSINFKELDGLSEVRNTVYHLERVRGRLLAIDTSRDTRARQTIRRLLRDIRTKVEALNRVADQLEADGEVDDGGDEIPSKRENICTGIDEYVVDLDFRDGVRSLCEALDTVRAVVLASDDEETAIFRVNGLLYNLRTQEDYALPHISWGIASLLAEEFRWVTKELQKRPSAEGAKGKSPSPRGVDTLAGALRSWVTDVGPCTRHDPSVRESGLKHVRDVVQSIHPEDVDRLSTVRTSLHRLELCKDMLAQYITCSDQDFHLRIREVLSMIKEKSAALEDSATQREAAGEADDVVDHLPSERDNICRNIDNYGLPNDLCDDVKRFCESLDRMRETVFAGGDRDAALMESAGRLSVLKVRPELVNTRMASELDVVFTDECRWLSSQEKPVNG